MPKTIKIILLFFVVFLVVGVYSIASYYRGINAPFDKKGQDKIFIVSKGESVKKIGENLFNSGLIKSKNYFEIYIWRAGKENVLQAGEYVLSPRMDIKEIVEIISGGKILSKEKTIKIIEGWRISEIDSYLKKEGVIKGDDFINAANNGFKNYEFFADAPKNANLEGFLFPDTYRIFKDAGAEKIIEKMLDNFENKLTSQMREDIKKQGRTIYETIIMASIIEKEVRTPEDMQIVSGIFWDRIKNGQALESCATLAYILGVNKAQYSDEDTKIDSLYNTYKYRGLPPSPISNPGLNAIKAAIYPKYTEYNYFLSRPDTGETVFSSTYAEHLENKAKYLK